MEPMALPVVRDIDPDKVAIYIRWSTEDQGDGTTLDVQMDGCRHYILSQGWNLNEDLIFIDEGWSGASLDRPAMRALREAVDAGRVECVVVFKLDRLSRSLLDTVKLVLDDWEDRCYIKSAREAIDTTSQQGKMFFYLLLSYAEWERATIKERTHAGKLKRAEEGRNPGMVLPYGYTRGGAPGQVVAVPEEAAVVRRIFDLYVGGLGAQAIARLLSDERIPYTRSKQGTHWKGVTIKYMVQNRLYTGDLVYGLRVPNPKRKRDPQQPRRLVTDTPAVVRPGAVPGIITRELFELAQSVRRDRNSGSSRAGRWHTSTYLLTGMMRCRACGGTMVGRCPSGGSRYEYYLCRKRLQQGARACDACLIRCDELDAAVVGKVRALAGVSSGRGRLLAGRYDALRQEAEGCREQAAALCAQLAEMDEQGARLRRAYWAKSLPLDEYRELKADLDRAQREARAEVAALEKRLRELDAEQTAAGALGSQMARLEHEWAGMNPQERKHLLRLFVQSVTACRNELGDVVAEIAWKTPTPGEPVVTTVRYQSECKASKGVRRRIDAAGD